jgi:hypothetical protein
MSFVPYICVVLYPSKLQQKILRIFSKNDFCIKCWNFTLFDAPTSEFSTAVIWYYCSQQNNEYKSAVPIVA